MKTNNFASIAKRVKINSEKVQTGDAFIAIVGEIHDGHKFIPSAVSKGAKTVFFNQKNAKVCGVEIETLKKENPDCEFVEVENTTQTLGEIAKAYLAFLRTNNPSLKTIAITGSVGKTTTKDLAAHLLSKFGKTVCAFASYNNEIGVPLTIFEADEETQFLILEIGANHIGEIANLVSIALPDVAVLLKSGVAHLGEFGSKEIIAQEKRQIFSQLSAVQNSVAVLNQDDLGFEKAVSLIPENSRKLTFSQVDALNFRATLKGIGFVFQGVDFSLNLQGEHNVMNALASVQIAFALGISIENSSKALSDFKLVSEHRMAIHETKFDGKTMILVDDAYNANPDSMKAALKTCRQIADNLAVSLDCKKEQIQTIAVLGEMFELGDELDQACCEIANAANENEITLLITVGKTAKIYSSNFKNESSHFDDLETAKEKFIEIIRQKNAENEATVIIFKGSNGAKMWELCEIIKNA